jgi:hypothetical protein
MSVKTVLPKMNLSTTENTDSNFSNAIWADCPFFAIQDGELPGAVFYDNFLSFPKTPATTEGNWGQYAQFSSTGGTITAGTGLGGEAVLASDGDDEGASIRTLATPFKIIRTGKKFWFEARVKASTITDTKNGFFLGLMENAALTAIVPIAADGTIADQNLVGFHRLEGDGDAVDTIYKANGVTQVTVGADAVTLVADTYVKLGMVFEPEVDPMIHDPSLSNAAKWNLTFYKNGVRLADKKQIPSAAGTDFPNDVGLGLVFAVLNATGTTPGSNTIDWWRAAQLY